VAGNRNFEVVLGSVCCGQAIDQRLKPQGYGLTYCEQKHYRVKERPEFYFATCGKAMKILAYRNRVES